MHHGKKLRKLRGESAHRMATLRNLVSALLHHETVKTTLPKAKIAARMTEKIITLGKKNTDPSRRLAMAFLMPAHHQSPETFINVKTPPPRLPLEYPNTPSDTDPESFEPPKSIMPKLFSTLAERYADRTGGYTRIHKFGRRQGDNAPNAIVSLVDGPRDLKFEMVARTVGRETAQLRAAEGKDDAVEGWEGMNEVTRKSVEQVLKFRGEEGKKALEDRARDFADLLFAEERAYDGHRRPNQEYKTRPAEELRRLSKPIVGHKQRAGGRMAGMSVAHTGLGIARGMLGRRPWWREVPDRRPRFLNETQSATEIPRPSA